MFRIVSPLARFLRGPFHHYPCRLFSAKPLDKESDISSLLKLADNFILKGKVRTAEDVYKSIIDKYPDHKAAYQKLWNSWIDHRSLKVTEKELGHFIEHYQTYIESKGVTTPFRPK